MLAGVDIAKSKPCCGGAHKRELAVMDDNALVSPGGSV
jgi:hypothetical protein